MSLTISSYTRDGVTVVKLGGAADDDVLSLAFKSLPSVASGGAPIVIDVDELTISSPAPFETLIETIRDHGRHGQMTFVCRRSRTRRLLQRWGLTEALQVYDSIDAVLDRHRAGSEPTRHASA